MGSGSESGFRNYVPKMAYLVFQGRPEYAQITTINMYLLIEIRHNILIKCLGNCIELEKSNFMLEIDILRNYSQKHLGFLRGDF